MNFLIGKTGLGGRFNEVSFLTYGLKAFKDNFFDNKMFLKLFIGSL